MIRLKDFKKYKLHAAKIALLMYIKLGAITRKCGGIAILMKHKIRNSLMLTNVAMAP
tara:strand:+ start:9 stop:179 length:171 start_codon:yes stop_codon:yes gene_type:complete